MPCTTILVGKKATFDGSTMMARNEDSPSGMFTPKKYVAIKKENQVKEYHSKLTKLVVDLNLEAMDYTAMYNALDNEGIWGACGTNEKNVCMTCTETITSNPRVLAIDPLVKDGIGEEDMLTITLPYIHSAKEGVYRLGSLIEKYGTCEMNGIGFQDEDEIWWFESVGGHHWIAKRVEDDCYVVMPNQLGIEHFDLKDAFTEKKKHLCSEDLLTFISTNHLDCAFSEAELKDNTDFNTRLAFGSHSDSDHIYNTPRAWFMLKYLSDGFDDEKLAESDDLPWQVKPRNKITVEDIKYVLSSYYQGTDFNPYSKHSDPLKKGKYRPIGISRNNFLALTHIRPYVKDEIKVLEWICYGSNAFNSFVPMYTRIDDTPAYLKNTDKTVTTDSFYWASRLIGALADAHFNKCAIFIERYQNNLQAKASALILKFDKEFTLNPDKKTLLKFNEELAKLAKELTDECLDKVLYTASCEMKNSFARSDA